MKEKIPFRGKQLCESMFYRNLPIDLGAPEMSSPVQAELCK
jgi:hypothetical protein